jgi:hypothetical protein
MAVALRMDTNRIPKQVLQYKPNRWRNKDAQRKDGRNNFTFGDKEQALHITF